MEYSASFVLRSLVLVLLLDRLLDL